MKWYDGKYDEWNHAIIRIITKTNNEIVGRLPTPIGRLPTPIGSVVEGLPQCFQLRRPRKWSAGRKTTGSDVGSVEAV
jgi:hypothetical protein